MSDREITVYVVRGIPVPTREDFERAKRDAEPFAKSGEKAIKALRRVLNV